MMAQRGDEDVMDIDMVNHQAVSVTHATLLSSSFISEEESIKVVLKKLHSIAGVNRECETLPIRRYLQIAMSHLDTWSIKHILKHYPDITKSRNAENGNLPIHDIVDQYFDVKGAIEEKNVETRNFLLFSRISRVKEILQLYIEHGCENNVGGMDDTGAAGLFELNEEKIDFVTRRRRTPLQILLSKFERILIHSREFTLSSEERKYRVSLLKDAKSCVEYCIDVAKKAWVAKRCKYPFTIMNVAIEVFPLLKLETMQYILHNFDQYDNGYPLHYKDLEGRTILIKAIHEATKRKQTWGDWKPRFKAILFDNDMTKRYEQCWIRDGDGRLPIHIAIEKGLAWNNGLKELAEVDSVTLLEPDPINGLQPFAYVASMQMSPASTIKSSSQIPPNACKRTSSLQVSLIVNLILANPAVIPSVPFTKK